MDVYPTNIVQGAATSSSPGYVPEEAALVSASIKEFPARLENLSRQLHLNGVVVELAGSKSAFILKTAAGDLRLELSQPSSAIAGQLVDLLPFLAQNQRPLGVVIQPGNPPSQALVLLPQSLAAQATVSGNTSISGNSFAGGAGSAVGAVSASSAAASAAGAVAAGSVITVTILPEASVKPAGSFIGAPSPSLPPNLAVSSYANAATSGAAMGTPSPSSSPPPLTAAAAFLPHSQAGSPQAQSPEASAIKAAFKPGSEIAMRVVAWALPDAGLQIPSDSAALAAGKLEAAVASRVGGGQSILDAGGLALLVRQDIGLPLGSKMLLMPLSPDEISAREGVAGQVESEAEAMQQIIAELRRADPQLAQSFMQSRMPQPNASLPSALLFMLGALRQGDVAGWLGEGVVSRLERSGKRSLIEKLEAQMKSASGEARDGAVGEWRSYPVPLYDNGQFQILSLHVHGDGKRGSGDEEGAGGAREKRTRFLIDLQMTRLGAMQIDGLSQGKRLNIVVRSESSLPEGLPEELSSACAETLSAAGISGGITFQTGRQHWMKLRPVEGGHAGIVT